MRFAEVTSAARASSWSPNRYAFPCRNFLTYRRTSTLGRSSHSSIASSFFSARLAGKRDKIPFFAKRPQCSLKQRGWELSPKACARSSAEQQPGSSVFVDRGGDVVETAEVDVAGRDREVVAVLKIVGQVDEAIAVPGVRVEVVEQVGTSGHD